MFECSMCVREATDVAGKVTIETAKQHHTMGLMYMHISVCYFGSKKWWYLLPKFGMLLVDIGIY